MDMTTQEGRSTTGKGEYQPLPRNPIMGPKDEKDNGENHHNWEIVEADPLTQALLHRYKYESPTYEISAKPCVGIVRAGPGSATTSGSLTRRKEFPPW